MRRSPSSSSERSAWLPRCERVIESNESVGYYKNECARRPRPRPPREEARAAASSSCSRATSSTSSARLGETVARCRTEQERAKLARKCASRPRPRPPRGKACAASGRTPLLLLLLARRPAKKYRRRCVGNLVLVVANHFPGTQLQLDSTRRRLACVRGMGFSSQTFASRPGVSSPAPDGGHCPREGRREGED